MSRISAYEDSSLDDLELIVLENRLVTPEFPTKRENLYLSSLDLLSRDDLYNRRVLFYKVSLHEQPFMIDTLKRSLAQVLVYFYPLAGRLAVVENGRACIDCSDQGVEFVDATVDASLHELESLNFQPKPFLNKLARWDEHLPSEIYDMPLLSIQVTRFTCGAIAVGFAHSHVIADGHSMWHFMNSWAECARNEAVSMPPLHMRTALKVDNPSEERAHLNFLPAEDAGKGEVGAGRSKEPMVERTFHFSTEMINKLKKSATEDGLDQCNFTSYEVLCAHWWRCIVRARALEDAAMVRFSVIANLRSRLTPQLPLEYFGNVIIFAHANATAGELRMENLAATAARIHEAAVSCNETAMWGMIHWLELNGNRFGSRLQIKGSSMKAASSPKFRVYGVDFGWGKPAAVRAVKVRGDGEMVLFPGREDGVDICMPLTRESMERLEKDSFFLNLC